MLWLGQRFPHYKCMGTFDGHDSVSFERVCPKILCDESPRKQYYIKELIKSGQLALEMSIFESMDGRMEAGPGLY